MPTFFQKFHDRLITELEYDRADMDRELNTWIEKNGDGKESLCRFYRAALELGESHFSEERFASQEQNPGLRSVYLLMYELFIKANWDRAEITRKLNELNMLEASRSRLKMNMVIIPPGRCQYGDQFEDQVFDLETAMKIFPLDYGKCEREGGCVCTVAFEVVKDENGRAVRNGN
jgi:hypothetical protein